MQKKLPRRDRPVRMWKLPRPVAPVVRLVQTKLKADQDETRDDTGREGTWDTVGLGV